MRRAIPFLAFIWVCGAAQAWGQVITTSIETNVTSGPSPLAVSFNATGTRHSNPSIHTNRFHELLYLWGYDDPESGTWAPTGKSRNHMSGPLGAHVYEPRSFPDTCNGRACKIFSPSLEVTDENGNAGTWSGTITVYDPNSAGAEGWGDAGETICISKVGNFTGCPLPSPPAQNVSSSATVQSLLSTYAGSQRRILFHAGETWNMTAAYVFDDADNGPSMIGSYGNGRATFNHSGTPPEFGQITLRPDDWRIQDINHVGSINQKTLFGADRQVKNLLMQRTNMTSGTVTSVLTMAMTWIPRGPDNMLHRHIFLVDNNWTSTDIDDYQFFGAAWGLNILGNYFQNSNSEHNIRTQTGEAVLISNNLVGPNSIGKNSINLRLAPLGTCSGCEHCVANSTCAPFCERPPRYFLVQDNDILVQTGDGIGGVGVGTCEGQNPTNLQAYDFIFERNFFRADPSGLRGTAQSMAAINAGARAHRFVIRNNVLDQTGWTWVTGFYAQSGAKAYHNTCYRWDSSGLGNATCISGALAECANNVLYAPNWSGPIRWWNPVSWNAPCAVAYNNFDDGMTGNITRNPFESSRPSARAGFSPGTGSGLIDAGRAVSGVFDDQFLHCRVGTPDVGAVERGAPPSCADGGESTESLGQPGKPILYP
jgi:hypothetical protein